MKQSEKTKITYDKIMEAAMDEFGKNGYAGASINSICATGIPKGLLYHNFKNKDTLYLSCVEKCFNALTEYLKKAEIHDNLQKYMMTRLQFFEKHTNEAHIFFDAVLQPPEALREEIQVLRANLIALNNELYRTILSSLVLRKGVSSEDALKYFTMQQTMFNGYFSSPAFRDLSFDEKMSIHESRLSQLLDFILYGIAERRNKS